MLSLILYGRNDSYGYNLHKRAAISLNCMAEMLTAEHDEIIFVDYNTPDDFPTFPEAIQDTLTERAKKLLRILRVRPSQHERYRALTKLVALEPISRNVAVRRSNPNNRWILSTNTDMVFVPLRGSSLSDVAAKLTDNYYHLPRFEVPETLWESADRLDPLGTIAAFGSWGREFHLNEIVYSQDPAVRYDAPGDFQLMLRSDLWRIHGFHEQMLLGWHVDSNIAKRMALIPYRIGNVLDDFYGYHCDHTRQVTPMHRSRATENSLQVFFEDVVRPEVPEQAETWGLAGEQVEELRIGYTSSVYLNALKHVPSPPLAEPYVLHYSGDSYNRVDYAVEHLIPFLADIFASYPRETVVGWVGSKRTLLERFAQVWNVMGFTNPILILDAATWLGPDIPDDSKWATEADFAEACDVFVFDWGRPDGRTQDEWRLGSDIASAGVTRAFRRMVKLERMRIADSPEKARRFVGVNAINNNIERMIGDHVGVTRSPLATRVRQGFVTEYRELQDLMPHLIAGNAARKRSGQIVAEPGEVGLIFYGPYIDLESSSYRLTVDVEYQPPTDPPSLDSGLSLELVSGPWLLGYHALTAEELESGTITRDFRVSAKIGDSAQSPRIETRLRTLGRAKLSVVRVTLEEIRTVGDSSADERLLLGDASSFADVNYVPLLHLGPAGVPGVSAGADGGFVIHANPGVANYICYGPYFWLPSGRYAASFEFMVHGTAAGSRISMYIVAEQGRKCFGKGSFEVTERGSVMHTIVFEIGDEIPSPEEGLLEFLVWSGGEIVFSLMSLRLSEVNDATPIAVPPSAPAAGLLNALVTTDAGTRLPDGIITLTRVAGFVFFGPYLEMAAGTYRLTLRIDRTSFVQTPANESGLAIEVVQGPLLICCRHISREECQRGEISVDFSISSIPPGDGSKIEFRLWTIGLAEVLVSGLDVEELPAGKTLEPFTEFDAMLMLNVGNAGERVPAPTPSGRIAIHGKAGPEGNVAHGPYVSLPAGRYEAAFDFLIERGISGAAITSDVVTDLGANVLARGFFVPKHRGLLKRKLGQRWGRLEGVLKFEVSAAAPQGDNGRLEFRTFTPGTFEFYLLSLRIRKVHEVSGEGP